MGILQQRGWYYYRWVRKSSAAFDATVAVRSVQCQYKIERKEIELSLEEITVGVNFPMLSDSRGRRVFKSRPGRTLKACNFEALEVTAMYFTFLETSSLYLFGKERS